MTTSDLQNHLEGYLDLRQKLGFKNPEQPRALKSFISYLDGYPPSALHMPQTAVDWACSVGTVAAHARRLSMVRGFLKYLRASFPNVAIPARNLVPAPSHPMPHIYSEEEIQTLLREARSLKPARSLRPLTYFTLIGLLASSGLRVGEAIRLQTEDAVLDSAGCRLYIRKTKFHKSRLVPVHRTTAEALCIYAAEKRRLGYDQSCAYFFVSEKKTPLTYTGAEATFLKMARRAGIRGPKGEPGPRLHHLRHTFTVGRMVAWYHEGVDVQARIAVLSTYLGHVRPESTYWYLTATPELMSKAAERFERFQGAGGNL